MEMTLSLWKGENENVAALIISELEADNITFTHPDFSDNV